MALLPPATDTPLTLPALGGQPATVHLFDETMVDAVNVALSAQRPLLVRGEPGTGKSQLARAVAERLGWVLLPKVIDAHAEAKDLLYHFDPVARLAKAQLLRALGDARNETALRDALDLRLFVAPGPLWWAFDWASAEAQAKRAVDVEQPRPDWLESAGVPPGCVVLLDEIDKADSAVPNGLLEALGHGRFPIPGGAVACQTSGPRPLVIVTTNEERALPDAFLRRCVVLAMDLPPSTDALQQWLVRRGQAHFPNCPQVVLARAAELLIEDRVKVQRRGLVAPGQAEYLDLLRSLSVLSPWSDTKDGSEQAARLALEMLQRVKRYVLDKHPAEDPV